MGPMERSAASETTGIWFGILPWAFVITEYRIESVMAKKTVVDAGSTCNI